MATATPRKAAVKKIAAKRTTTQRRSKVVTSPDDWSPEVQPLIPEYWLYEDYVPRQIVGNMTDLDMFAMAHKNMDNVLLYGPTGSGKTSAVLAYAALHQLPFYSLPCGMAERRHLFGGLIPEEGKAGSPLQWFDGPVTQLFRYGGVLLLNEINFLSPKAGNTLFEGLDKRRTISLLEHRSEKITGSKKLLIAADFNPEYEGTRPLNAALRNRFRHQEFYDYDDKIERTLLPESKALLVLGKQLRKSFKDGTIETPISTNMLVSFDDLTREAGLEYAVHNFVCCFSLDEQEAVRNVINLQRKALEIDYYGSELTTEYDDDELDAEASMEAEAFQGN